MKFTRCVCVCVCVINSLITHFDSIICFTHVDFLVKGWWNWDALVLHRGHWKVSPWWMPWNHWQKERYCKTPTWRVHLLRKGMCLVCSNQNWNGMKHSGVCLPRRNGMKHSSMNLIPSLGLISFHWGGAFFHFFDGLKFISIKSSVPPIFLKKFKT